ncbi:MAG: M56 family metallopeptidase [Terrimicrobiaceae bacterium]
MSFSVCLHTLIQFFEWTLRSSWQGAILIGGVLLAQLVFRRQLSARWRFNLWLVVVLRLLMPFSPESTLSVFNFVKPHREIFPVPVAQRPADSIPVTPSRDNSPVLQKLIIQEPSAGGAKAESIQKQTAETITPDGGSARSSASSFLPKRLNWLGTAAVIWLLGAAGLSTYVILLLLRTRREVRRATPVIDPVILDVFEECRELMGIRRSLPLLVTNIVKSPALCGVLKPALLLPPGLTVNFSLGELRYVFLHELGHVKRHDVSLNWLLAILQILHWFNPVVWFGFARMRADRELACDALAISFAREEESKDYGRTIIKLLETLSRPSAMPGLVGILEDRSQMKRRIRMIAAFKKNRRWSIPALLVMAALAATGLTDAVTPKQADTPPKTVATSDFLSLTVLDAATGTPIKNAQIITGFNSAMEFLGAKPPVIETDELGVARIPCDSSSFLWRTKDIAVLHPAYEPKAVTWAPWGPGQQPPPKLADIPQSYTIKLDRGVEIGGIVRDEEGHPVPNVRVEMRGSSTPMRTDSRGPSAVEYPFYNNLGSESPVTDAQGRWRCDHFPKQIQNVNIVLVSPDNSTRQFRAYQGEATFAPTKVVFVKFPALLSGQAEFVLKTGVSVLGKVVDVDGNPLSGIQLAEVDGRKHARPLSVITTGSDGRFELPNRDPHQILIKATGPGFAMNPVIVDIKEGMPEVRIQMHPAKSLRIHVVDEAGNSLPKTTIAPVDFAMGWSGESGNDGLITWNEAPAETVRYVLKKEGYRNLSADLLADGTEQKVTMQAGREQMIQLKVNAQTVDNYAVKSFSVKRVLDGHPMELLGQGTDGEFATNIPADKILDSNVTLRIESPGFYPVSTARPKIDNAQAAVSVTMGNEGPPLGGQVLLPSGAPAENAKLMMSPSEGSGLGLLFWPKSTIPEASGNLKVFRTDDMGRFSFPSPGADRLVVIVHQAGFLKTTLAQLQSSQEFRLQGWGRIEGVLTINSTPKADVRLQLNPRGGQIDFFSLQYIVSTESSGRFVFNKVPPGNYTLICTKTSKGQWPQYYPFPVQVVAGETTTVEYKNEGRNVFGKLQAVPAGSDIDWPKAVTTCLLSRTAPDRVVESPQFDDFVRMKDYTAAQKRYSASPGDRSYDTFGLDFEPDGTFRAEGIPPGEYELHVEITDPAQKGGGQWKNLGSIKKTVVVPPAPDGDPASPVDLGTFPLSVDESSSPKKTAPVLDVLTFEGKELHLADYRGKTVMVTFWATWAPPSSEELESLKAVADAFGANPRFAMLGVALDEKQDQIQRYTEAHGIKWVNTRLEGASKSTTTEAWGVDSLPATFLVGPDGFISGRNIKSDRMKSAIEQSLTK